MCVNWSHKIPRFPSKAYRDAQLSPSWPPSSTGEWLQTLKVLLAFDTSLSDSSSAVVSFLRQMQPLTKGPVHAASLRRTPSFSWVSADHVFFLFFLSLLWQYLLFFSVLYLHCSYSANKYLKCFLS